MKTISFQLKSFPQVTYIIDETGSFVKIDRFPVRGNDIFSVSWNRGIDEIKNWEQIGIARLREIPFKEFLIDVIAKRPEKNTRLNLPFNIEDALKEILMDPVKIFPEFRQRPGGIETQIFESLDGSQVASVLYTLRNGTRGQKAKWERIRKSFEEFFPSLTLDIRKIANQVPRVIVEKPSIDHETTLDNSGSGISEFIVFITHLIDSSWNIFCLDCSEIHFHPHAQRRFIRLLETYSGTNQFIIITHSPNLVSPAFINNLAIVREENGRSIVHQLNTGLFNQEEERKLNRLLTPETREIFFSNFVLMVEGSTEKGVLPIFAEYMNKNLDERNASIIEVGGCYFEIPMKLCNGFELPFLVVCDRDALMNITTHFDTGENRLECSPVIRSLLSLGWLDEKTRQLITERDSVVHGRIKRYVKELFEPLSKLARQHNIYVLTLDFEVVLKRAGYTKYFDEIKRQGIKSKPIIGRYIAQRIVENRELIPEQFIEALNMIP